MMKFYKIIFSILMMFLTSEVYSIDSPVTIDSRIKTYIYSPDEVFSLKIYNGYQSTIELAMGEEVETLSLGDTYAWKITPIGRRIFIKPLEDNVHTNMTIITNKRTYQFDIMSIGEESDKNLAYVVRFLYASEK